MEQAIERQGISGGEPQIIREVSAPLFEAKGWMRFLGVLMILYGVLMIMTIVGILICWLPIWLGVCLLRAAGSTELAQTGGDKIQLMMAMSRLRTFFTIQGILALIGLILAVIFLIAGGVASLGSLLMNA